MKVLVIPDVHLKPVLFVRAADLLEKGEAERAVCLMDIADDWDCMFNLDLYFRTFDRAAAFARAFPDTLWCWGNHDVCYLWNQRESGYSAFAAGMVCRGLMELKEALPDPGKIAFLHRIDNVLFSHAGLSEAFVRLYAGDLPGEDTDAVIERINSLTWTELWQDISPIWYRHREMGGSLYREKDLLQVTGHTPVRKIRRKDNLIECDVFSTYPNRRPIGTRQFLILDTLTWEWKGIS